MTYTNIKYDFEYGKTIKRIKNALRRKTGKEWSVTGGSVWGCIRVQAPESRRVSHRDNPDYDVYRHEPSHLEYVDTKEENRYTSEADRELLAEAFGLSYVHYRGVYITSSERESFVEIVEKDMVAEEDPLAIPLEHPCQLCGHHPAAVCTTCYDEAAQRTIAERSAANLLNSCSEAAELAAQLTPIVRQLRYTLKYADILSKFGKEKE